MNQVYADIVTIGDEILYGHIVDTNSQWLSEALNKVGIRIRRKLSIGDTEEEIMDALQEGHKKAQVVITTGGLGPTKDDLTKKIFASYFKVGMTERPEVTENLKRIFASRKKLLNELNLQQALVPENGEVIANSVGTAPGMWFENEGTIFISMPGVPHEMKKMMAEEAIPRLQRYFQTPFIYHRMVKTIGIAEAILAEKLEQWENALAEDIKLAYLPRLGQVRLRLTAIGEDKEDLKARVNTEVEKLKPLIEEHVYAYDDEEVEHTVGQQLLALGQTLATAESCTGGLIADKITDIAGCSAYYQGGVVAYSNDVKVSQLGVSQDTLQAHGAVSEQTAIQMAEGARKHCGADYAISTTGVAGPGGGTPQKPVGTIWVGYADKDKSFAKLYQLTNNRMMNINFTYNLAMNLLRRELLRVAKESSSS